MNIFTTDGRSKRRVKMLSDLSGVILFVCAIFRQYSFTCMISAIVFMLFVINSLLIERDRLFLKYFHVLTVAIEFLIGVYVCDNTNTWLGEINETTFYAGAFNLLALYYWIIFTILRVLDPFFFRLTKRGYANLKWDNVSLTDTVYKYAGLIIFLFGTVLFVQVIRNPFFSVQISNRFVYSNQYISRMVNIFRVFPTLFACLLSSQIINGELNINKRNLFSKIILPYIPFILFLIWTGNKFGAFKELIYIFLLPIVAFVSVRWDVLYKLVKMMLIILLSLGFFLVIYYLLNGNTLSTALSLIQIRVACQGEIWWKMIAVTDNGMLRIPQMTQEFHNIWQSIITEGASKNYGIYRLMNILGNPATVMAYSKINTRFTSSGIELPFYYLRYLSFILIPCVICPLISWITNCFINAVKEKRFVASIASARILLLVMGAITQGDWYTFFSFVPMVFIVLLIFSNMVRKRGNGYVSYRVHNKFSDFHVVESYSKQ